MFKDKAPSIGHVYYKQFDANGNLKDEWELHNLVVTAGKNFLATWLAAASQAGQFMQYIAAGSGSTSPSVTDTALVSELGRVAGTLSSNNNVWQNIATFGPGVATGTWQEAGLFSAAAAGTMFARQTFSAKTKDPDNTIQVTWQVTLA